VQLNVEFPLYDINGRLFAGSDLMDEEEEIDEHQPFPSLSQVPLFIMIVK